MTRLTVFFVDLSNRGEIKGDSRRGDHHDDLQVIALVNSPGDEDAEMPRQQYSADTEDEGAR